jgi:hypothetical protein
MEEVKHETAKDRLARHGKSLGRLVLRYLITILGFLYVKGLGYGWVRPESSFERW